jgi:hypothetical protein
VNIGFLCCLLNKLARVLWTALIAFIETIPVLPVGCSYQLLLILVILILELFVFLAEHVEIVFETQQHGFLYLIVLYVFSKSHRFLLVRIDTQRHLFLPLKKLLLLDLYSLYCSLKSL